MTLQKVFIVDDSRMFRTIIKQVLQSNKDIKIIGEADNGKTLLEQISTSNWPDFITLDVEMPILNGLETLKELKKLEKKYNKKIKVIMLSSLTIEGANTTIKALEEGAYDFIAKPVTSNITESLKYLKDELLPKFNFSNFSHNQANNKTIIEKKPIKPNFNSKNSNKKIKAIIIGVSTGGPKALSEFLPKLTQVVNLPILIVQHMPPTFTKSLADNLNKKCNSNVVEAGDNMEIQSGYVYIAQGGKHMVVRKMNNKEVIGITNTPPENNCKPSVDVLFRSAATIYNGELIAIILTGMGDDGSKTLFTLKRKGAKILVQDKESSVVWGMPGSAYNTGHVDEVLPLLDIPTRVKQLIS